MIRTKNTYLALLAVLLSPMAASADVHTYEIRFEGGGLGRFDWDTDNELASNLTWDFGPGLTGGANPDWTSPVFDGTWSQFFFEIVTATDVHPLGCNDLWGGCGLAFYPTNGLFGYPNQSMQFSISNTVRKFYINDSDLGRVEGSFSTRFVGPPTFNDVPAEHWAFQFIETVARKGITAGCGNDNYCPNSPVTRAQLAVLLVSAMYGHRLSIPAATGRVFSDVAADDFAASFIEQLFWDRITAGCGNSNYCSDAEVSRAQMAVLLLRAKYGSSYYPPWPYGIFDDVPASHWAAGWIEQLADEGITSGCGNGNYCPDDPVTRDQMAVFLVRTFRL